MEENEDEPEDVRLATPVEDEIKKADEAEELAKENVNLPKKRVKVDAKKRNVKLMTFQKEDEDDDCCANKKRMRKDREAKWGTVHIFDKECKLLKRNTIPRHCLSKKEHLNILATSSRKCEPQYLKTPVNRKLKPISPRIAELARPPMQRILRTIEDRGDTIAPELLDNLINMVEAVASLNPEQAAQLFHDKKSRSTKKYKKKKGKIKCRSKKEKEKEKRKEDGDYPLFDPEAVCCQYLMAERFVKSILDWKCPIPKEEYRDIADVILRRLSFIIEYTPIDNGDRKSQQMRFLADVISCWISGVLLEVAEAHKEELEEECVRRKQAEEEETEEEEEGSEEETERTLSRKSDEGSEDEKEDKAKDEDKEDEGNQKKKSEKESAAQTEEQNVIEEGEAEEEVMSHNGKPDEEETEKKNVEEEEEEAESQTVEEEADANKILEDAEIARKRAEEEELARKQVEEEAEMKRLEEEEAEKKRLEDAEVERKRAAEEEAEVKRIEEAENARLEEEQAEMKKLEEEAEKIRAEEEEAEKIKAEEEAEQIRVEEEAEQKKIEEAAEKENKEEEEEAESNRIEDEALEEGKMQDVDQSALTEEIDLTKPVEEKSIPETKEFIPIETDPPLKVFQSDLPFVTFIKICNTLYSMIENEKGNTGQDSVTNRLHRSVYEMFQNAVLSQNPSLLTDSAKDVIDVMAGKIATWLSKVLTESQVHLLEKYPAEAESKEVRDWSNWIDHTTETAGNWSLWLQKLIEEVKKMQDNKVTRGQWEDFTQNLNKNAFLWRRFHLDTVHKAHHNVMMLKDREVVKTGEKKTPDYPERELNVFNLE